MREIERDELEPLATGAWILGAGGGGNPYLSYLNLCRLYDEGARASLLDPLELADDDFVAMVASIGAPLVGQERLPDPRLAAQIRASLQYLLGQQIRPDGAFDVVGPGEGAIPETVINRNIRIDYVQHVCSAMIRASEWIDGPDPAPP